MDLCFSLELLFNYTTVITPSPSAAFNGTRRENWPPQTLISPTKSYLAKCSGNSIKMCLATCCFHVRGQKPKSTAKPWLNLKQHSADNAVE